jgi:hypothetical protein
VAHLLTHGKEKDNLNLERSSLAQLLGEGK